LVEEERVVTAKDVLTAAMAPGGGIAVHFAPMK
jgi:hypothetical protein